jgi:glucosamine 6-phosphate synthetase-like amidotransferase/phosphosugar isomerase protein
MCGIGGVLVYQKNRTVEEIQFIKELVTELAVENMARGKDATGVAVFNKGGHDVLKHNIPADEMVATPTWQQFLDKNISDETYNILVHTRAATKGLPSNNDNNHPLISASAIGVHNGWVSNDDKLFHQQNLFRLAQVDSEVIFRLFDKEIGNERENVKSVAEQLSGAYAVAFVKKNEPHILNYFRNNNPTTFAYIPELNIIIFASQENFLKGALATVNASTFYHLGYSVSEQVEYFQPAYDVVMQFDVTENTPTFQLAQEPLKFKDNDDYYYGSWGGGWQDEEDWYYDWKYGRDEAVEEKEEKTIDNIYEFIEAKQLFHLMSDEDYTLMIELLDQNEKGNWSEGYKSGRGSLDNEISLLKDRIKKVSSVDKLA